MREPSADCRALAETRQAIAEEQHRQGEDVHAPAQTMYEHPEGAHQTDAHLAGWCKTIPIQPETSRQHPEVLPAAPEVPYGLPETTGPLPEKRSTFAAKGHEIEESETALRNVAV